MKKILTAICCTAMMFGTSMTAHATETLDRDYIESEIWEAPTALGFIKETVELV